MVTITLPKEINTMKRLFGSVALFVFASMLAVNVVAQNTAPRSAAGDKWVISAKAGGVNHIQGTVNVERESGRSGLLLKGDNVEVGDRVTTTENGRVEILLNPGSYLRVAENTSFEFKTTSLEDLQLSVTRGSVILEVFAANDFRVSVDTPKEDFGLIQTGVYRVDVAADGVARLEVWKGKAEVGDTVVKGGRAATSGVGDTAVAKFDRDDRDAFETWSRDRSKELAKATNSLRDRELRTSLMSSFLGGRWNMYDSFGLWVFDRRFGRYCFLPFGYGWSSPYGYGFGTDIWWYNLPRGIYYQPPTPRPPVGGNPTPPTEKVPPGGRPPMKGEDTNASRRPSMRRDDSAGVTKRPQFENRRRPFESMQGGSSTGPRSSRGMDMSGDSGFGRIDRRGGGAPSSPASAPISKPSQPVYSPPPSAPIRGAGRVRTID